MEVGVYVVVCDCGFIVGDGALIVSDMYISPSDPANVPCVDILVNSRAKQLNARAPTQVPGFIINTPCNTS